MQITSKSDIQTEEAVKSDESEPFEAAMHKYTPAKLNKYSDHLLAPDEM